eukprot:TRINITY_DN7531_c4_g1_i2.p1 TRINITY_DN7531_c4_g1~~TRINITY_DN7531_c4_g1_i2.p1  ORF type:complete len:377 (+),score=78.59 TRINITY_DN7531_c4_g1_i2:174-1304(+)
MVKSDVKAMVIDMGRHETKFGAAHTSTDMMGRVRTLIGVDDTWLPYIGSRLDAAKKTGRLSKLINPLLGDINYDVAEKLWAYTYEQTGGGWDSSEHPILSVSPSRVPRKVVEDTTQVLFERFNVPSLQYIPSAVSSLYGAGKMQGIAVDMGTTTTVTPVYNGTVQQYAVAESDVGGAILDRYYEDFLSARIGPVEAPNWTHFVKESTSKCSLSFNDALAGKVYPTGLSDRSSLDQSVTLQLPDGKELVVSIGKEAILGSEVLFRPSYAPHRLSMLSVPEVLWECVQSLPFSLAKELVESVVISGGTSLISGFSDRLPGEIDCISTCQLKPKVTIPRERVELSWKGASIAATLPQFEEMWITKQQYNEIGPSVAHGR